MVIAGDGREEKVVTSCMDGMIRELDCLCG